MKENIVASACLAAVSATTFRRAGGARACINIFTVQPFCQKPLFERGPGPTAPPSSRWNKALGAH